MGPDPVIGLQNEASSLDEARYIDNLVLYHFKGNGDPHKKKTISC